MAHYAIGIDLGGTKIEVAIVDSKGIVKDSARIPTGADHHAEKIISNVVQLINTLRDKHPGCTPAAAGIGIAGQVDDGRVTYSPNLQWKNIPLKQELNKLLSLPVTVVNDVRAATYGEWQFGAGKGSDDMICIFVGTGIGGGIVSGGNILSGYHNTAGEFGHMTIDLHGPECHCGNRGCFEALAGGWAIQRNAAAAVQQDPDSGKLLLEMAGGDAGNITTELVSEAATRGDALAVTILQPLSAMLVAGMTGIVNALGPQLLVLGGGIIDGMPQLVQEIDEGVKKYALKAATAKLKVVPAQHQAHAGVIGAAMIALSHLENIPQ